MLWVVIGHAGPENDLSLYPGYAKFIYDTAYSFHMPLFIFISGFLFFITRISRSEWEFTPMIIDKLKRFGIPFVTFTILGIFIKHVFSSSVERPTDVSFVEFFKAFLFPNDGPMREFWFLATIMWYFALFPLWRKIVGRLSLSSAFLLISVMLHYFHPDTTFLAVDTVCIYMVYFFCGLLAGSLYLEQGNRIANIGNRFFVGVLLASLILYALFRYFNIELLEAMFGIVSSFTLSILLDRYTPGIFSSFRSFTFQIFLMGIFFQVFVKLLRLRFELPFLPMYALSVVVGLYLPVLISVLVSKIQWKPLKMCIGLK